MIKNFTLNMRLFWQGASLSYVALFRWLTPITYMASKIVSPLAQMIFFVVLGMYATGKDSAPFYVIGNAMQITAVSGIYGVTMSIGGDRWTGTLPYLFGTPANRFFMFTGRALVHILDGMIGVFIGFFWGVALLGLDLNSANPLALLITVLVTTLSTSGLGLLLGSLSLVSLNVMFVNNTVYFLLLLFSGANVDLTKLPLWIQSFSNMLPLTRGIASARMIVNGASLGDVAPLLFQEFIMGMIYISLGYFLFRWFEMQAKRKGTLEAI